MKLFEKISLPIIVSLSLLIGAFIVCFYQQSREIRLIVRGDDMGFCHAANVGCIKSYRDGIMTAVEVMVPCSYFLEAAEMLNENPGLDVGVHLTLTSEWENMKWGPLTHAPSLVDENGYFFPMVWPNEDYPPNRALGTSNWKIEEIENELRAQIEKALIHIPHCSHLTPHMAFHEISREVVHLVLQLAREYDLDANIRLLPLKTADLFQHALNAEDKINNAVDVLENLGSGTWQFVDHPGVDTPEMRLVWHIGDEDVAVSRDAVTKAFTSSKVKEVIARRKIKLIGYKDLKLWH